MTKLNYFAVLLITLLNSCNGSNNANSKSDKEPEENNRELFINKKDNRLNRDIVTNGLLDKDGNMWFTTLTEGVYKYDGSGFINLSSRQCLPHRGL